MFIAINESVVEKIDNSLRGGPDVHRPATSKTKCSPAGECVETRYTYIYTSVSGYITHCVRFKPQTPPAIAILYSGWFASYIAGVFG